MIPTSIHRRIRNTRAAVVALLGAAIACTVAPSRAKPLGDDAALLLDTRMNLGDGEVTAEKVVATLKGLKSLKGIFEFRITPSLFGKSVKPATSFGAFIEANQNDERLAFFHDLGKGTVQIYSPARDVIETSIPLSKSQWPTLKVALGVSVHTGPNPSWPARYESGSVRVRGTPAFNEFVGDLVENLRQTELPEVLVFPLNYASADNTSISLGGVSDGVKTIASEGVLSQLERLLFGSVGGSEDKIIADTKHNAILIVDRPEMRPYYQGLIDRLDVERELVEITAAIIDIETMTGLEWQSQFIATGMERADSKERYIAGLGVGDDFFDTSGPDNLPGPALVNNTGLNVATMFVGQHYRVISKLRALEQEGTAKVMSRPSILTIDNQPARITDTVTAYLPIRGERTSQLYDITSGLSLTVLPRIVDKKALGKKGRRVYLAIDVGDGDIGMGGDSGAGNTQRDNRIATQTILRDSESLLIGGRYINQQTESDSGIPILKKIPVLGLPFKDKTVQNGRLQRLYLITPKILTWREAQLREQQAAEMLAAADVARAASAAEVTTRNFDEPRAIPPKALPAGRQADRTREPEARRGLFRGGFFRRLRNR